MGGFGGVQKHFGDFGIVLAGVEEMALTACFRELQKFRSPESRFREFDIDSRGLECVSGDFKRFKEVFRGFRVLKKISGHFK